MRVDIRAAIQAKMIGLPILQGNGSIVTGAIESGNPSYWAGYGIPSSAGSMIGTNAIIVKPCSSCATGIENSPVQKSAM